MINNIVIIGRLTRDPEMYSYGDGKTMARLGVAVERNYKSRDGEKITDYFDVKVFRQAEFVQKYFSKGSWISVVGSMECDKKVGDDGQTRTFWNLVAEQVSFCSSSSQGSFERPVSAEATSFAAATEENDDEDEDELPF